MVRAANGFHNFTHDLTHGSALRELPILPVEVQDEA